LLNPEHRGHTPALEHSMPALRMRALIERRVPQYLGGYLAASYGIVEFVNTLVDRYVWSPHLVTLALFVFALFVPTVALIAWYHGRPGRDGWARVEKIGIPVNVVVAVGVLGFLFRGQDLGAATMTVAVADEEGNVVQAEVPKAEFRRRLAVFYFENETGDPDLDWLSYGIPEALDTDLDQDLFVSTGVGYDERLKEKGFEDARNAPNALLREIARDALREHFLTGSVLRADGGVEVRTSMYETETSRLVAERTYAADGVFALVDSLAVQVKRDLDIPRGHLEAVQDLPVSDLYTESPQAFEEYARAYMALQVRRDFAAALTRLEAAVSADPTFALAHWQLATIYTTQNRGREGEAALQAAMDHVYRLPQSEQFQVKVEYYQRRREPDKALAVSEMRIELQPDDIAGYASLASQYLRRDRPDDALAMYERILEIDPGSLQYLNAIGAIHKSEGRYDAALAAYRRYASRYPDQAEPVGEIAGLFLRMAELDSARAYYERASLLDADDISLAVSLANLDVWTGDFEGASARLNAAETRVRTPNQTILIGGTRVAQHAFRGEIRQALQLLSELHVALQGVVPPSGLFGDSLILAVPLMAALGDTVSAFSFLRRFGAQAQPPFDDLTELSYLDVYRQIEDADAVEERIPAAQAFIDAMGYEAGQFVVDVMKAEARRWRGNCEEALPLYESVLASGPAQQQEVEVRVLAAKCLRETDLDAAEAMLDKALRQIPAHAGALVERARIQQARGDDGAARTTLQQALGTLANADPEYRILREARALATALDDG
jgi:Tfp pilus assembly protein PilF/TolB-like protein